MVKKDAETGYGSIPQVEDEPSPPEVLPSSFRNTAIAEVFGTATLVQIGCGGLCVNLYLGGLSGMGQVAGIWILGATLAIYATAAISGGHLNPAVTLSFALVRPNEFPFKKVVPYWIAQLVGAFLAGVVNLIIFHTAISRFESKHSLSRGDADSILSASAFGDYWSLSKNVDGAVHALFIEAFGTGFLTFVIFAATNRKNPIPGAAVPPIVGTAIGMMIALLGALTGAGINPARDFGPRLVTLAAGWGTASMTNAWVYIVGPLVGGPVGAFLADKILMVD